MRRSLALLVTILLISCTGGQAIGDDFFDYPARSTPVPVNHFRAVITENYPDNRTHMSYSPFDPSISEGMRKRLSGGFPTVLTPCDSPADVGCIQEVSAFIDGSWQVAEAFGVARTDMFGMSTKIDGLEEKFNWFYYKADASKGLFESGKPLLWSIPGAAHRLGSVYNVNAVLTSFINGDKAEIKGIEVDAWATASDGVRAVNLPANLRLRVVVRLGSRISELSGWFDGRIKDADIDFGMKAPGVLSIEGSPVRVSTIATDDMAKDDARGHTDSQWADATANARGIHETAFGRTGLDLYKRVENRIKERAVSTNTYWRLSSWTQPQSFSCPGLKGVLGVALTNATTYEPNAPTWNKETNSLDFRVASSHFLDDGAINVGYYRLLISDAYAKCLWGANATKRSASISVLGANGETEVATTTFGSSNGWIHFDAEGYHYSSPTITVKLLEDAKSEVIMPLRRSTTITCAKGKIAKKITGVAPKCPTGYKKK